MQTHRILLTCAVLAASGQAIASPDVVSDAVANASITHCAWYLDTAAREVLAAPKDGSGNAYCSRDVSAIAAGSHTLTAAFVVRDAVWGEQEGPKSVPFAFTRPALPAKPSVLRLVP